MKKLSILISFLIINLIISSSFSYAEMSLQEELTASINFIKLQNKYIEFQDEQIKLQKKALEEKENYFTFTNILLGLSIIFVLNDLKDLTVYLYNYFYNKFTKNKNNNKNIRYNFCRRIYSILFKKNKK